MKRHRIPYTVDQLRACLAAAEARYATAAFGQDARMWLDAQHALRDRIAAVQS